MTKYLLAYHGGQMAQDEAEQAKVMAAWGEWFTSLGAAVVDGGAPVGATTTQWWPDAIASQAPVCAAVGARKLLRNHAAVAGEKRSSTSTPA